MDDIETLLELARGGHRESALHGLIGLGPGVIPALGSAFRAEADPAVRDLVVEVAWQVRSPDSLPLLAEALRDPAPAVWKQALDGLVTLGSRATLGILEAARDRPGGDSGEFSAWLDEAIADVGGRINE